MVNVSLEEALEFLVQHTKEKETVETLSLAKANYRLLAEDIYAPIDQPPFDRSPLDGYAFKSVSSNKATKDYPVTLKVIGEVCAGYTFEGEVKEGEAVRIMTGAPIPRGCDCVLRQEATDYGEKYVQIYEALKPYSNYCYKGEDIKEGTLILKKGTKLSAITLGVLASVGISEVKVKVKPKIALLCTGDELMRPGEILCPGKIYSSNEIMLKARAEELGVEVIVLHQCGDTPEEVAEAIQDIIGQVDLVVTTGAVSVGKKDILHEVVKLLGAKRLFWRVAMQPGTPVLASVLKDKLIISLSGNPFAALANFELLVRPTIAYMMKDESLNAIQTESIMMNEFSKASKKRRFIRASYEGGKVYLNHTNHASGSLFSMSLCNCLIDIPAGTEKISKGDLVKVILL